MRILFIEDDPMNRRVVGDMLRVADVEMIEAEDAETGLSLIESTVFDVILVDLRMPRMSGLTAIGHIRGRDDAKASVPIIVITADTARDLRSRCLEQGADELLLKPVAMNELYDAIGRVIATRSTGAAVLL